MEKEYTEDQYDEDCAEIEEKICEIDTKGLIKEISITWKTYEEKQGSEKQK